MLNARGGIKRAVLVWRRLRGHSPILEANVIVWTCLVYDLLRADTVLCMLDLRDIQHPNQGTRSQPLKVMDRHNDGPSSAFRLLKAKHGIIRITLKHQ